MFAEIDREYLRPDATCTLALVICTIGRAESQTPQHRPEGFSYHHMLWVEAGEGLFQVDGISRILGPGEGLFCRQGVPHGYERSGAAFSTRWLTFLGGEGLLEYFHVPDSFFFSATAELDSSTAELDRLCQGGSTIISRSAAGYSMLTQWLASVFGTPDSPAAAIRQYLEAHFAEPLSLDDIGAQVSMDRFSLCRYYRENMNMTVMEQLKRIRIAKAKQYLRHASCSIEEVGLLCGYNSPSYFGKIFREETGRSPREYREQYSR